MTQTRAQVASYQVPPHPSGLEMRTQLNQIVMALVTQAGGPVAPVQTFPLMMWGDTTAGRLRMRNLANDAWTDLGPINDFLADIRTLVTTTAAQKVNRAGDSMTGSLNMEAANLMFLNNSAQWYGYLGAYGNAGAADSGVGFVDSTLTQWNCQIGNDGDVDVRGSAAIRGGLRVYGGRIEVRPPGSYGEVAMYSSDGTVMFLRGRSGGGGMEWVNHDYNAVLAWMDNNGSLQVNQLRVGGIAIGSDGNIVGGLFPQGIHAWVAEQVGGRAIASAQVQHGSGVGIEVAALNIGGGTDSGDLPGPWVCVGLRRDGNNWIYLRGAWLRNQ